MRTPRVYKQTEVGPLPAVDDSFKIITRETESVLQAHFYSNLMVKSVFQIKGEVCWLNRETRARDVQNTCTSYCRQFIVSGTFLYSGVRSEVEVYTDFYLDKSVIPQWQPRVSPGLCKVSPTVPRSQWELYSEFSKVLAEYA